MTTCTFGMAIVVRADKQASREPNNGVGRRVRMKKFLRGGAIKPSVWHTSIGPSIQPFEIFWTAITAEFLPLVSPFIPFFEVLREQQAPE